jgi:hypothetical protein
LMTHNFELQQLLLPYEPLAEIKNIFKFL